VQTVIPKHLPLLGEIWDVVEDLSGSVSTRWVRSSEAEHPLYTGRVGISKFSGPTINFVMKLELGRQPKHPRLKQALADLTLPGDDVTHVIVHHYTDTLDKLQLEVETRIPDENALAGIKCIFQRMIL
jgi:hypothetical protein